METSQEEAYEMNCDSFQRQKLPWLRTLLHERGIQTTCDGKAKRKAELAELAVNAPKMKLPKVSDGESDCRIVENRRRGFGHTCFSKQLEPVTISRGYPFLTSVTICLERLTNIQRKISSHSRASLGIGCL